MYQKFDKIQIDESVKKLRSRGTSVFYGIDATKLDQTPATNLLDPNLQKFDRIVFNFPHAGFSKTTD